MCGFYFSEGDLKEQWDKAAKAISGYHIHVYFETGKKSEMKALEVTAKLEALFAKDITDAGVIYEAIGPHTSPNREVDIPRESFGKVVEWLQQNGEGLSILIHPRTGDELKDHLQSALWLGKPVPFNDKFFEKLKVRTNGPKAA